MNTNITNNKKDAQALLIDGSLTTRNVPKKNVDRLELIDDIKALEIRDFTIRKIEYYVELLNKPSYASGERWDYVDDEQDNERFVKTSLFYKREIVEFRFSCYELLILFLNTESNDFIRKNTVEVYNVAVELFKTAFYRGKGLKKEYDRYVAQGYTSDRDTEIKEGDVLDKKMDIHRWETAFNRTE